MSDLKEIHPHNARKYDLPKVRNYKYGAIHYRIEHLTGMFPKWIALIQYELKGRRCTGVLYTETYMFMDGESYLWINTSPLFNNIKKEFPRSLPDSIKSRFPHLNQIVKSITENTDINLDFGHKGHFGDLNGIASHFSLDVSEPDSYDMDNKTASAVEALFSFVIKAEDEYNVYTKSRIYKHVLNCRKKAERAAMPAMTLYALYRIARMGMSIYNGISDNNGDTYITESDSFASLDIPDIDNTSQDSMIDYLCTDPDTSIDNGADTDNGVDTVSSVSANDISFTGNGDKYTDNSHNQFMADRWMAEAEKRYQKGDRSGGDRAMAAAKSYLSRIKN